MRLRRLDLTRYGKFTDRSIEFGDAPDGAPDLHIVYGPNEAGKSTALAAFLDLLFGIETRSRYDFLHSYKTMRIGASLDVAGGVRDLVRIKQPQRSLLDASGQPIPEALLAGELGGLDRSAYRTMFSLDDDTLEAGGDSILASKGDLGQLLFSASAGLADLSRTLVDLNAEAEDFHKLHARNSRLAQFRTTVAQLKEQRDGIDTFAAAYVRLFDARNQASVQYEKSQTEWNRLRARMDQIQRHLNALPRLSALRRLRERLSPYADLPEAPLGWRGDLPDLQRQETELATRAEHLDAELARLSGELDAIAVDAAAMRFADDLDRLTDLRARHRTADLDIPERRRELRDIELAIAAILSRLGRDADDDPTRFLIDAPRVAALRKLIESRSGVAQAVEAAQEEASEAVHRLGQARTLLGEAVGAPGDEARLAATIAALRDSDHAARRQVAARACATQRETLAERVAALLPWQGEAGQLAELAGPGAAVIDAWKIAADRLHGAIERHHAEIERLEGEQARLQAECDAIGAVSGLVNDREASAIRGARERAWADHRQGLDARSADLFEAALRRDDLVMAARLGHQRDVARLHDTARTLAVRQAELEQERTRLGAVLERDRSLRADIAASARALALPETFSAAELAHWLAHRARALETRALLRQAERDLREADADAAALRARLVDALVGADLAIDAATTFETLVSAGQSALDRAARRKALQDGVADRARDVATRERALQKAATADRAWQAAWREACSASWLGDARTPTEVREILLDLENLRLALDRRGGVAARIGDMAVDQAAFAQELGKIAGELGMDRDGPDLAREIEVRIQSACAAAAEKANKSTSLEQARERRRALGEAIALHAGRKREMIGFFAVASLGEVGQMLQNTERKADLLRQADEAGRDVLDSLQVASIGEAEAVLDAADRATLEVELAALRARFDDEDRRKQELYLAWRQAADRIEAVGSDDDAAMIEEKRRTVLLEIEEGARRFLRLRVGIVAAEKALRVYRDRHRSSMMKQASEAFRLISRNAYRSLTTSPEKDGDVLIAVASDGSWKAAADLSKGTRFQLYLALRAAGYHEFARLRRPVPFVADDIMETFDDFRAEETFRLFGDMAKVGQIIYLTHHAHLCDIARRVVPAIRVHALEP